MLCNDSNEPHANKITCREVIKVSCNFYQEIDIFFLREGWNESLYSWSLDVISVSNG